jgi:hypothetical protein
MDLVPVRSADASSDRAFSNRAGARETPQAEWSPPRMMERNPG